MNQYIILIGLGILSAYCMTDKLSHKDKLIKLKQQVSKIKTKVPTNKKMNFYQNIRNKREMRIRKILTAIYNCDFSSCKPKWLINPKTGRRLEIDCFNAHLKLCVEISSDIHKRYIPHFHKTYQNFLKYKERDLIKRYICEQKGYKFIDIPHTIHNTQLESYIISKLG